jgi:hypothetical protein
MRKILAFFALLIACNSSSDAQIKLGAYYFDGWTGKSSFHLNETIIDSFAYRKPIWGWITSTPQIIQKQIDLAANAGISFFNFCWYYSSNQLGQVDADPKNNALNLFREAQNKSKLGYAIMIANHKGYLIDANDWDNLMVYWCSLFKDKNYLKVNQRPLITFFSIETLIKSFGGQQQVNAAFDKLKKYAKSQGLKGVTIGAILSPSVKRIKIAEECGFDLLTTYNQHALGLSTSETITPIEEMQKAERNAWDEMIQASRLPLIPTVTLNWDTRPLDLRESIQTKKSVIKPRFEGFSELSVKSSIKQVKNWIYKNISHTTSEKIVLAYAWNEYGEGAWLTPSDSLKNTLLQGLKEGLTEK